MNKLLENKTEILPKLGSFWVNNTSETDPHGLKLVRAITRLIDEGGARGRYQEILGALNSGPVLRYNFSHHFLPVDVFAVDSSIKDITLSSGAAVLSGLYSSPDGNDIYVRLINGNTWVTISGEPVLALASTPGEAAPQGQSYVEEITSRSGSIRTDYVVRLENDFNPIAIESVKGTLVEGISFINGGNYIRFFDSPYELFPDKFIHIRSAYFNPNNLLDYTFKTDTIKEQLYYLAQYYRSNHSAYYFELALNEVAGRVILREESKLVERRQTGPVDSPTYIYTFDNGTVAKVNYEHHLLEVGQTYSADYIISRVAEVHAKPARDADKWWQSHFNSMTYDHKYMRYRDSFYLQDINPAYPDFGIPSRDILFLAVDTGRPELAIWPDGNSEGYDGPYADFNALVEIGENRTGNYWNDFFNLSQAGYDESYNFMDFAFEEHGLSERALIINVWESILGEEKTNRLIELAKREMPLGCVPIIRKY